MQLFFFRWDWFSYHQVSKLNGYRHSLLILATKIFAVSVWAEPSIKLRARLRARLGAIATALTDPIAFFCFLLISSSFARGFYPN